MHTRVQLVPLLQPCIMLCFPFACVIFQTHSLLGLAVTGAMGRTWICMPMLPKDTLTSPSLLLKLERLHWTIPETRCGPAGLMSPKTNLILLPCILLPGKEVKLGRSRIQFQNCPPDP